MSRNLGIIVAYQSKRIFVLATGGKGLEKEFGRNVVGASSPDYPPCKQQAGESGPTKSAAEQGECLIHPPLRSPVKNPFVRRQWGLGVPQVGFVYSQIKHEERGG